MNITDKDYDEIVAIQFGDEIIFGQPAVDKAIALQDFTTLHPRSTFKFMACMDLGPQWQEYSKCPTIFTITQYKAFVDSSIHGSTR